MGSERLCLNKMKRVLQFMDRKNRLQPLDAAKQFIELHFPNCQGALLAGSVVRGEATETSDLDIVIFMEHLDVAYRESFVVFDWAIETFVHNLTSFKDYFKSDCERARPSLPRMVVEGIVLQDTGVIEGIKVEAGSYWRKGLRNGR